MRKTFLSGVAAAATILAASAACATTAVIDGHNGHRLRPRGPTAPDFAQPGLAAPTAQIQIGQVTGPGNPLEFANPGWDPFGLSDTTHH